MNAIKHVSSKEKKTNLGLTAWEQHRCSMAIVLKKFQVQLSSRYDQSWIYDVHNPCYYNSDRKFRDLSKSNLERWTLFFRSYSNESKKISSDLVYDYLWLHFLQKRRYKAEF